MKTATRCAALATLIYGVTALPSWAAEKSVTLMCSGYNGATTLADFQALIRLTEGQYGFSYADCADLAGGSDVWFSDEQGTILAREIDTWNENGQSDIWVKIPTLTNNTIIVMHWGETPTAEQTAASDVNIWGGFVGVWHMGHATKGAVEPDVTGNGLDAVPDTKSKAGNTSYTGNTNLMVVNPVGSTVGGVVGGSRVNTSDTNKGNALYVTNHVAVITDYNTFTIGGWFYANAIPIGSTHRLICSRPVTSSSTAPTGWELTTPNSGSDEQQNGMDANVFKSTFAGRVAVNSVASQHVGPFPVENYIQRWMHLCVSFEGTNVSVYGDGELLGTGTLVSTSEVRTTGFWIGRFGNRGNYWNGSYDEIRMFDGVQSADRVKADYDTMKTPNAFFTTADTVVSATWTGAAGDGDVSKPGNWNCYDVMGLLKPGALPGSSTAITIAGDNLKVAFPENHGLEYASLSFGRCKLGADCDWRGLGAIQRGGVIDLNGNDLTLKSMPSFECITDSSGEYEMLDFLASTANGYQFIDTGCANTPNTVAELKVSFPALPAKADLVWPYFGGRTTTGSAGQVGAWIRNTSGTVYHYSAMTDSQGIVSELGAVATDTPYVVRLDNREGMLSTVNGDEEHPLATGNGIGDGYNMLLFTIADGRAAYAGSPDRHGLDAHYIGQSNMGPCRMYYCRIWDGETPVRDFVPVRRVSDGELGMLDRVHGAFYPNAGNEASCFVAGSVTNTLGTGTSGGSLIVEVPNGATLQNMLLDLAGSLKLVKTGGGTFNAARAKQTYYGGTVVNAGVITCSVSGPNRPFGAMVYGTGTNLVRNGDFEEGEKSSSTSYSYGDGYSNPHWTITPSDGGGLAVPTSVWVQDTAPVSKNALFIKIPSEKGKEKTSEATQQITVETAGLYRFAFSYARRNNYNNSPFELSLVKDSDGTSTLLASAVAQTSLIFRRCDGFVRIEEPGSYTLRFRISRDSNVDQAAMIDNVSFTLWEGDHGEVVVNNGGTLDVNAQPDFRTCHFVLNGGTLRNNGSSITTATNMVKIVRLATNSTIHAGNSFGLIGDGFSPATLFLDGHTLNATRGGSRALYLCDAMLVGGGTVEVPYTGWVQMGVDGKDEANYGVKASGIVFNIAGWQKLYSSIDVLDYNMTYTGTSNDGTGTYIVHGTFTPVVDVFSNCRMLDGSVIDLSERTTALPLVSNFSSGGNTLHFADGAAVGVKLGSRQVAKGTAVISWTAETSPDATVTFVRADADRKYRLVKESDGLYYYPLGGLMMIVR